MTPDDLFNLPPRTLVTLNGEIFCRVESDPASGIPEFISKDGLGYDVEDLDGAEIYQPAQDQGL